MTVEGEGGTFCFKTKGWKKKKATCKESLLKRKSIPTSRCLPGQRQILYGIPKQFLLEVGFLMPGVPPGTIEI
jgi:hypothetical protein